MAVFLEKLRKFLIFLLFLSRRSLTLGKEAPKIRQNPEKFAKKIQKISQKKNSEKLRKIEKNS